MKRDDFFVFTNLAISFDGKIATKAREHSDPTPYDRYLMDTHRRRAHAVLFGAATLRAFRRPATIERRRFQLWRKARQLPPQPINVILAHNIDFDPTWPFFADPDIERVLVVPDTTPESSLEALRPRTHVFKYTNRADFPEQIISYLKQLGCRNLLLEGGGGVMFPWVQRDLIDEWNVTISPVVIGGQGAPTMVEGVGFSIDEVRRYSLHKHFRRGNQLFLQYTRLKG